MVVSVVEKDNKVFDFKFTNSDRAELFFEKLNIIATIPHFIEEIKINFESDKVNIQEMNSSQSIGLKLHFPNNFFTKRINMPTSVKILTNDLKWGTIAADKFMKKGENITIKIFRNRLIFLGNLPDNFCEIPILGIFEPQPINMPESISPSASNVNVEDISLILSLLDQLSTDELFNKIEYSPKGLFIQGEINRHSAKHQIRCKEISTKKMHTFISNQSLKFLSKLAESSKNIKIGIKHEGIVHATMDFIDGAKADLFIARRAPNQD